MAASGPSTSVPEGLHYETKYVLLSYLGLPPPPQLQPSHTTSTQGDGLSAQEREKERSNQMKKQIEEELRLLEEEIAASFSRTGFDCHTSPVFSPANPESSIEDCLANLGDRVALDLDVHLASAVHTLLSGPLDYERFRAAVQEVCSHSQGAWNKVLVPLVVLQALQVRGQSLSSLLALGVRYLEEEEAEFIIQQGGWGTVFGVEEAGDPGVIIAEDSNDIYILSGEQAPDQLSPPASLLTVGDSSGPGSWQTESLPVSLTGHESWAQVGMMDPEDAKSLDSTEGVALAEERSENNSSNSDIVHVEREEAELLEEGGETTEEAELQESVLSVLGTESELAALRAELREETTPLPEPVTEAAKPPIESAEQVLVMETPASLSSEPSMVIIEPEPSIDPATTAGPPASEPPAAKPDPVPAPVLAPVEPSSPVKEVPPALAPEPEPELQPEAQPEPVSVPSLQEIPTEEPKPEIVPEVPPPVQEVPVSPLAEAPHTEPVPEPAPESSELPVLLYGGAALIAIAAVVAYGALAYRKK
ncbi:bcl-2-like protein 13 isoform X2 [Chanos chanos]|uniref:Bcl-2-like protein 13 isoform X2 n=1 Tax=Chanos chanos TaxID=29144 RepID=A0A6J2UQH1_CHACN|nr:bcl-2-like protein 13 isoform X2 [Chanos chanos]